DDRLVDIAVLAQIDRCEVKTEHVDGTREGLQPPRAERLGPVTGERSGDDVEVGAKLAWRRIGARRHLRRRLRVDTGQFARGRGESRVDADQRLTVRLVAAVRIDVVRVRGELEQRVRRTNEARRQRQLAAEAVNLGEVV